MNPIAASNSTRNFNAVANPNATRPVDLKDPKKPKETDGSRPVDNGNGNGNGNGGKLDIKA